MGYSNRNIETALGDDGILVASIDMPGRAMNVFSSELMDALEGLLDYVDATPAIKGVVLTSGKESFIVGADLDMIREFTESARHDSYEALHALCGRLGRLFRRLETSGRPYVAAMNGLALGGGLELALACHRRLAADTEKVLLGLPEVKLGLLPGAGGTQRLPRLIAMDQAIGMLLTGEPVSSERALGLGLIDQRVALHDLVVQARLTAASVDDPRAPWDKPDCFFDDSPFVFTRPDVADTMAELVQISADKRAVYPAYDAILKCIIQGWGQPMDDAWHQEMDVFIDLIRNPVAGNMVRTLFLERQRAARAGRVPKSPVPVRISVSGHVPVSVRTLLERSGIDLADPAERRAEDIVVHTIGEEPGVGRPVIWLRHENAVPAEISANQSGLWLADATEHGRIAEVVAPSADEERIQAALIIAQQLRVTPIVMTRDRSSLLDRMARIVKTVQAAGGTDHDQCLAVALIAAQAYSKVVDPALADVGIVLAGLHPAYTGGPYTYLSQHSMETIVDAAADAKRRLGTDIFSLNPQLLRALEQCAAEPVCA